jgi:hypothetical protein
MAVARRPRLYGKRCKFWLKFRTTLIRVNKCLLVTFITHRAISDELDYNQIQHKQIMNGKFIMASYTLPNNESCNELDYNQIQSINQHKQIMNSKFIMASYTLPNNESCKQKT